MLDVALPKTIIGVGKTPTGSSVTSPHTPTFFKEQEIEKVAREDQKKFHSTVMRIMFYAVRVHPDIVYTVNYLSTPTRLGTATTDDHT